jgi:hypothetical protein
MLIFRDGVADNEKRGSVLVIGSNLVLTETADGLPQLSASLAGGTVSGSGSTGRLARWTGSTAIGDSLLSDDTTNVTLTSGQLIFSAGAAQIRSGATSFAIRDSSNSNDNLLITNAGLATIRAGLTVTAGGITISAGGLTAAGQTISAATLAGTLSTAAQPNVTSLGTLTSLTLGGALTFTPAASKVVPGATSLSLRNNADSADNVLIADNGTITFRNGLTGITTLNMSGQLTNTVSTGTAPFVVSSTTKVTNLNADLLDGLDATAFLQTSAVSGTSGALAKFTGTSTLGNSLITESGSTITVGAILRQPALGTVTTPASTPGWYRVATLGPDTGGTLRGAFRYILSTLGGSWTPVTYLIDCFKDWSTGASVQVTKLGTGSHVTGARVVNSSGTVYLEIEVANDANGKQFSVFVQPLLGHHDTGFSYVTSGALTATTGGTVFDTRSIPQNTPALALPGALSLNGHLTVDTGSTYDLASSSSRLRNLYLSHALDVADNNTSSILRSGLLVVGDTSITASSLNLILRSEVGKNRMLLWQTGTTSRWMMRANSSPEGGANAGSDFQLYRYDDAGSSSTVVLTARRSDGRVSVNGHFVPETTTTFDLGSTSLFFNNIYGTALILNGAGSRLSIGGTTVTTNVGMYVRPATLLTGSVSGYGLLCDPTADSGTTSELVAGFFRGNTAAASYTITAVRGLRVADAIKGAGSTITTQYGLVIDSQTQGASNYAVFTSAGLVRLGDPVSIGSGSGSTNVLLFVTGTPVTAISNATQVGILARMTGNASATTTVEAVRADPRIDTATTATMIGVRVLDATATNGGVITNQYGLKIDNQTVGTNKWSIFTGTGLVHFGDDVNIASLGRFDSGMAPTAGYSLVYDGVASRWRPKLLTLDLASSGVVNAGVLPDGTSAQYADTALTLSSTVAVAPSAPLVTAGYQCFLVEFTTALNSATAQKYVVDYLAAQPLTGTTGNSGTATGSQTSTTLVDTGRTGWTTDQWKGKWVVITGGTGAGQARYVTANTTGGSLTVTPAWSVTPVSGNSTYLIGDFTYNAITTIGSTSAPLTKIVHSGLTVTPTTTYVYRYRVRGEYFTGTASAGASNTITTTSTSPSLNAWAGRVVTIRAGTGVGQVRTISSNTNGANSVVTVSANWTVTPDATSVYDIDLADYSACATAPAVSQQSAVSAFAVVLASQIAAQNLAAIVSSLGQVTASRITVDTGFTINPAATTVIHGPSAGLRYENFSPVYYRNIADAASVTTTSITVTGAGWTSDMVGKWVRIVSGTGIGQQRLITSVTNGGQTINWTTSLTLATTSRWVIESRDSTGNYYTSPAYGSAATNAVQLVDGVLKLWGSSAYAAGLVARPDDRLNVLLGEYTVTSGGTTTNQVDSSWTAPNAPSVSTGVVNIWAEAAEKATNAVIASSSPGSAMDGTYLVRGTLALSHNLASTTVGFVSVEGRVDLEYQVNGSGTWLSAGTVANVELSAPPTGSTQSTSTSFSYSLGVPGTLTDLSVRLRYYVIINATKVLSGSATCNGSGTDVRWTTFTGGSSYARRGLSLRDTTDTTTQRAWAQLHFEPTLARYLPPSAGEGTEGEVWWNGLGHGPEVYNGRRPASLLGTRKFVMLQGIGNTLTALGMPAPTETNLGSKSPGSSDAATNFVVLPAANSTLGTSASVQSLLFVQPQHDPTVTFVVRTPASYANMRYWFGLTVTTNTNSQTPSFSGAQFRFLGGTDTQWQVGLGNSTAFSPTGVGPTVAVSTTYFLRLRFESANSRVYASVNGSAEVELTTNFPPSTTALGLLMQSTNTSGGTTSSYEFSYATLEWGY